MQYDVHAIQGLRMLEAHGIHSRDQQATPFRQATRAIVRSGKFSTTFSLFFGLSHILSQNLGGIQKQAIKAYDAEVATAYEELIQLQVVMPPAQLGSTQLKNHGFDSAFFLKNRVPKLLH